MGKSGKLGVSTCMNAMMAHLYHDAGWTETGFSREFMSTMREKQGCLISSTIFGQCIQIRMPKRERCFIRLVQTSSCILKIEIMVLMLSRKKNILVTPLCQKQKNMSRKCAMKLAMFLELLQDCTSFWEGLMRTKLLSTNTRQCSLLVIYQKH